MRLAQLRVMRRVGVCLLLLASCNPGPSGPGTVVVPQPDGGIAEPPFVFETPAVQTIAPNRVALGDLIQVFGSGFLPDRYGTMFLHLDGDFTDDHGERHGFRGDFPLRHKNPSLAEFEIEHLVFSPSGDRIGLFTGSATVVSRLSSGVDAGLERRSNDFRVSIDILPSIEINQLKSVNHSDCQPVTMRTIGGTPLAMGLIAVGIGQATQQEPMTFRVTFQAPSLAVRYVREDVWGTWPPRDAIYVDAPQGQNTMTFTVNEGDSLLIDPSWKQDSVQIQPPVNIGQEQYTTVSLGGLAGGDVTPQDGPITNGVGPAVANIIIEARSASGATARRVVHLELWDEWEIMPYNGNQALAERFPAEIPSGQCGSCIPGGDIGREVNYSEGESVSRSRRVNIHWDVNVANSLGVNVMLGPWVPWQVNVSQNTTWAETFGVDMDESVSTEMHRTFSISAQVLPTYYGLCYRQLSRYERRVDIRYHSACGVSAVVGEAVLVDWGWGFDVATGRECPPESNLPPPQTFSEE